jgi:hypothetical protein
LPIAYGCRVYRDAEGRMIGSPPIEVIRAAVDAHRRGRLQEFQREEAAKVAQFAREIDAAESAVAAESASAAESAGAAESAVAAESASAAESAAAAEPADLGPEVATTELSGESEG